MACMATPPPLRDVFSAGLAVVARSRAYHLLDLDVVKLRLVHTPDQVSTHAESGMTRALYDCVSVLLTPTGPEVRLVVATHAAIVSQQNYDGGETMGEAHQ